MCLTYLKLEATQHPESSLIGTGLLAIQVTPSQGSPSSWSPVASPKSIICQQIVSGTCIARLYARVALRSLGIKEVSWFRLAPDVDFRHADSYLMQRSCSALLQSHRRGLCWLIAILLSCVRESYLYTTPFSEDCAHDVPLLWCFGQRWRGGEFANWQIVQGAACRAQ